MSTREINNYQSRWERKKRRRGSLKEKGGGGRTPQCYPTIREGSTSENKETENEQGNQEKIGKGEK